MIIELKDLAIVAGVVGTIGTILWRSKSDRRWAQKERDALTAWRTSVDGQLERLTQWRLHMDDQFEKLAGEIHKLIRRLDKADINGK